MTGTPALLDGVALLTATVGVAWVTVWESALDGPLPV